jgi:hypothetical protein
MNSRTKSPEALDRTLSRRNVLRGIIGLGAASALAACGVKPAQANPEATPSSHEPTPEPTPTPERNPHQTKKVVSLNGPDEGYYEGSGKQDPETGEFTLKMNYAAMDPSDMPDGKLYTALGLMSDSPISLDGITVECPEGTPDDKIPAARILGEEDYDSGLYAALAGDLSALQNEDDTARIIVFKGGNLQDFTAYATGQTDDRLKMVAFRDVA